MKIKRIIWICWIYQSNNDENDTNNKNDKNNKNMLIDDTENDCISLSPPSDSFAKDKRMENNVKRSAGYFWVFMMQFVLRLNIFTDFIYCLTFYSSCADLIISRFKSFIELLQ